MRSLRETKRGYVFYESVGDGEAHIRRFLWYGWKELARVWHQALMAWPVGV